MTIALLNAPTTARTSPTVVVALAVTATHTAITVEDGDGVQTVIRLPATQADLLTGHLCAAAVAQ